jgi:stage IV sporulation protein FA
VYHDGVSLTIPESYLIPAITEGMVVFIGNKEYYNNTIIIEDLNGVYIWYGNVSTTSLKLYDYVEKGTYIGEAERNLYMVFSKDNKYLNYEEFLK